MTQQEALKWAIDQLNKLVTITEDGGAYVLGSGVELAGFASNLHAAEEAAQPTPLQVPVDVEEYPIPLNDSQKATIEMWAADKKPKKSRGAKRSPKS